MTTPLMLMRQQSWLSPSFPIGSYSYSHGVEWAVEAGHIHDRVSLVDWLEADLRFGSGRNEAIFFSEASRSALTDDRNNLFVLAELAASYRGTAELALESAQQATACLQMLRRIWPDEMLDWMGEMLQQNCLFPSMAVVLGIRSAREGITGSLALGCFLQSYVANLITAGVRLIPLGQTDGQLAVAALEQAILDLSSCAVSASVDDLGSAALMVDLASMSHEQQYTRLFRS